MALKQRRGKAEKREQAKASNRDDDDKKKKQKKPQKLTPAPKHKKKVKAYQALLFVGCILGLAGLILYHFYNLYGPTMFLGKGYRDYNIEPYQWRKYLDDHDKTILLVGGPHRSGTTIMWKAVTTHPEVAGFGDPFASGADYSEGILMQDVYPAFGVGMEFRRNLPGAKMQNKMSGDKHDEVDVQQNGGLGQYALLPEEYVHFTKKNHKGKLDDPTTLSKLLNRFAPCWDSDEKYGGKDGLQKAKVWVEKSPQNIVLSDFLEGVYNMPIQEDGTISTEGRSSKKTVTKFLFMTRHPIPNILATDIFIQEAMGGKRDLELLLRNYIQMHKYGQGDAKKLDSLYLWVKFEDFVANPAKILKGIYSFLDVPNDDKSIEMILEKVGEIKADPNLKYKRQWCEDKLKTHKYLVPKYNDEIKALGLGYDLASFCD